MDAADMLFSSGFSGQSTTTQVRPGWASALLTDDGNEMWIQYEVYWPDDWSDDFAQISCATSILHGEQDSAVPINSVRSVLSDQKTWAFDFHESAGQTLLHTHPSEISHHINALFGRAEKSGLGVV